MRAYTVAPLEWKKYSQMPCGYALVGGFRGVSVTYLIKPLADGKWETCYDYGYQVIGKFGTLDEAKEAAQQDFEKRLTDKLKVLIPYDNSNPATHLER